MFIRHRHMAVSANSAFSQSIVSQATSACAENGCGFVCHVLYWWAKGLASRGSGLNAQTLSARRWHLPFAGEGARATLTINKPRIHLHAIVVMPDHVHILLRPLRDENGWPFPLVDILQCFKGATSHRINKLLGTSGPLWEEESFDHVLRSDESLKEKCEYIRQNPVRARLVRRPEEYRWLWVNPEFKI
jgi:REP element-mobilizing transposase RayT